ncbi:phosphotransferase family protein [Nocardia sp. GAS34]|uniref:phosphotransferase family protein n=1 Tax=unclassified Nocardia TaxID=2637762 RepID=UPI003D19EB7B
MNPILPGLSVDTAGLSAFLSTCVPDAGPLTRIEPLAGGISNLTLLAECGPHQWVLRRRPVGNIPEQTHDMRREYETLRMLAATAIPVPAVYGYSDDSSLIGAPFYVMDFVPGVIVQTTEDARPLHASVRARACDEVVRILAELHAIPLSEFPTYQPGRSRDVMARHLQRWHDRWNDRPHREIPLIDRIAAELRRRLPTGEDLAFVHGDYRIGNMIIDPHGGQHPVRAVLDWELSTFGHPLTDLAHLLAYWEGTGAIYSHRAQRIAAEVGFPSAQQMTARYCSLSGRSVEHLPVFIAFEHWRAAIIKEAIYQRRVRLGAPQAETADTRSGVDSHVAEAAARLDLA